MKFRQWAGKSAKIIGPSFALCQAMQANLSASQNVGYAPTAPASAGRAAQPAVSADGGNEDFFHRMLDIVNPLQHLPIIGTLYRNITGDHIGTVEKIAGDALYGGLWGAVSSVADVAFEAVTGKSVEDSVLAMFTSPNSQVQSVRVAAIPVSSAATSLPSGEIAQLPPVQGQAQMALSPTVITPSHDIAALATALTSKGADDETVSRALYAYRRTLDMTVPVSEGLVRAN